LENTPWGEGKNISRCQLGGKYEREKRKRGQMYRKRQKGEKKNEERGKKIRKLVK
jgi:hypothetical protein